MNAPLTTHQIMETEELHFVIGENIPKSEIARARKLGGRVIILGSPALLDTYERWQECHRESQEPFTGWLVHDTADLNTEFDLLLDAAETMIDRNSRYGDDTNANIINSTEVIYIDVADNPEYTADSVKPDSLARIIGSITIKHSWLSKKDYEDRQFYLSGDADDPQFLAEIYDRRMKEIKEQREAEAAAGLLDDHSYGTEPAYRPADLSDQDWLEVKLYEGRAILQAILPELLEESTTIDAVGQIEKESEIYGFKVVQL